MRSLFLILIAFGIHSCAIQSNTVYFKNNSENTGFYEADSSGVKMKTLDGPVDFYMVKESPTIGIEHIESLKLGEECYGFKNEICVDFTFDIDGTALYEEMTHNNLNKQIFFVIDGKIISAPNVMGVIPIGKGQYVLDKKYFDEFFKKSK